MPTASRPSSKKPRGISEPHASRAIRFVESLRHVKGRQWAGKQLELSEWQRHIVSELFGRLDATGLRRYRTAYIETPRKTGKSTLSAALALYLLMGDDEPGAEIYSAATDQDQASLVFSIAAAMVARDPYLSTRLQVLDHTKRIVDRETGSFYHAISAKAASKHGYNAHGVIYDELHAALNRELWDVLKTSMGAREQPLMVAITTAGYDRTSICWEQHEYAHRVTTKQIDDSSFFGYIAAADENDPWDDPKTWYKANPHLGVTVPLSYYEAECAVAKENPAYQNTFRRLYLSQWTQAYVRWFDLGAWDACGGDTIMAIEKRNAGRYCYMGLDLASAGDLAAYVLVFPRDDEGFDVLCRAYLPQAALEKRTRHAPVFRGWAAEGYLPVTPGDVIDYDVIKADIMGDAGQYRMGEIGYDPWRAVQITMQLQGEGLTCVPVRQGFATLSPPAKLLETLVSRRTIHHGGHPIARWCADNVQVETDAGGNIKPSKKFSTEKIDVIAAIVTALDRAMHADQAQAAFLAFD